MFNRLGFQCVCCGTPLTGGLDTFGSYNCPMCQEHYLKLVPDNTAVQHEMMLLNRQRNAIDAQMRELRAEAEVAKDTERISRIEASLRELDRLRFTVQVSLDKYWGMKR